MQSETTKHYTNPRSDMQSNTVRVPSLTVLISSVCADDHLCTRFHSLKPFSHQTLFRVGSLRTRLHRGQNTPLKTAASRIFPSKLKNFTFFIKRPKWHLQVFSSTNQSDLSSRTGTEDRALAEKSRALLSKYEERYHLFNPSFRPGNSG